MAKIGAMAASMRGWIVQWYGCVCRRETDKDIRRVAEMGVRVKRKRGRLRGRRFDTVNDHMGMGPQFRRCGSQDEMAFDDRALCAAKPQPIADHV